VFGQPTSTYYAMLTQYDPSISCGKSACTYIAGLATLAFLNHRDALVHDWESLIRRAASVIMMGQLSNSGTHSNLVRHPEIQAGDDPLIDGCVHQ